MIPRRNPLDNLAYVARRSGLWVPTPLRWWPCADCCGDCDCRCANCSTSDAPCCFRVTFASIANDGCTDCSWLNQSFYLTQTVGDDCIWECSPVDGMPCDPTVIRLTVYKDGTDYKVKVELGNHIWEKNYGTSKPDCCGFSSESITHITDSGDCDTSSATCSVTALRDGDNCPCNCLWYCEHCANSLAPYQLELTVTGIANNGCACGGLNDTFILDYSSPAVLDSWCEWKYTFPAAICTVNEIRAYITAGSIGALFYDTTFDPDKILFNPWDSYSNQDCCNLDVSISDHGAGAIPGCTTTGASGQVVAVQ